MSSGAVADGTSTLMELFPHFVHLTDRQIHGVTCVREALFVTCPVTLGPNMSGQVHSF